MIEIRKYDLENKKKIYDLFKGIGGYSTQIYYNWLNLRKSRLNGNTIYLDRSNRNGFRRECERYFMSPGIFLRITRKENLPIELIGERNVLNAEADNLLSELEKMLKNKIIKKPESVKIYK